MHFVFRVLNCKRRLEKSWSVLLKLITSMNKLWRKWQKLFDNANNFPIIYKDYSLLMMWFKSTVNLQQTSTTSMLATKREDKKTQKQLRYSPSATWHVAKVGCKYGSTECMKTLSSLHTVPKFDVRSRWHQVFAIKMWTVNQNDQEQHKIGSESKSSHWERSRASSNHHHSAACLKSTKKAATIRGTIIMGC